MQQRSGARLRACSGADARPAHNNLNATLWMENTAEYEATVRGVYAAAQRAFDLALADPQWNALPMGEASLGFETLPPAIIVDADETFINNVSTPACTTWVVDKAATSIAIPAAATMCTSATPS